MLFPGTHGFYLDSVPHKFLLFQVIVNLQWLSPATPFKLKKISVVGLLYPLNLCQALRVSNNVESDFSQAVLDQCIKRALLIKLDNCNGK